MDGPQSTTRHLNRLECFLMDSICQAMQGFKTGSHPKHHCLFQSKNTTHIATLIKTMPTSLYGVCMPDGRLPKKGLFSQPSRGKIPQHKPKARWRDCPNKTTMETQRLNRSVWSMTAILMLLITKCRAIHWMVQILQDVNIRFLDNGLPAKDT